MWIFLAKQYANIVFYAQRYLNISLPGLGFLCRRIKLEHIINVQDRKYYFYKPAASRYSLLITGRFAEPETHLFFRKIIPQISCKIGFVDVGAAVGEMVIDAAGFKNVDHVLAFEPEPDLVKACKLSAAINEYDNVTVIAKAVAEENKTVNFKFTTGRGSSGFISKKENPDNKQIVCTTLDSEIPNSNLPYMVLIDVEGDEPLVLSGAKKFIKRINPLIIFEFIGGQRYDLSKITGILGQEYEIYRLRSDGHLDNNTGKAWNCVAVHKNSIFYPICKSILKE